LPFLLAPTRDRLATKVQERLATMNIVAIHEDDHETLDLMGREILPTLAATPPAAP
jgi:hypothetical protein